MTGSETEGIMTVLHPVSDLEKAKPVYSALIGSRRRPRGLLRRLRGRRPAHRAGAGRGPQGMTSPVAYWHVPDIEAKLAEVTAAGRDRQGPPRDVGGGRLVATFTDPDGNVLGLIQDQ